MKAVKERRAALNACPRRTAGILKGCACAKPLLLNNRKEKYIH
ncbi:hypothetical protein [Candidatus Methanoperedens nitratireducens]|nr:hypothetical protein [Candidatus Methanoperedens nitroreducens]